MKPIEARIKCINGDCKNFGITAIIDLDSLGWDVQAFYAGSQVNIRELFYHIPQQIHCKECFSLCTFEILS